MNARVLILVEHYLPGFKSGGPIQSIANLIATIGGDVDVFVLTRDRDAGDSKPFENVERNRWVPFGAARVRYLRRSEINPMRLGMLCRQLAPDVIYANGLFGATTQAILLAKWLGLLGTSKLLIAPRGQLSAGALSLRSVRKRLFLSAVRLLRLTAGCSWHATAEEEAVEIRHHGLATQPIEIARNIPRTPRPVQSAKKEPGLLRCAYLSRITAKKNLLFFLQVLQAVRGRVILDIAGPISDSDYWRECERQIARLPPTAVVRYCGSIAPDDVGDFVAGHDLFVLPTLGENYGHSIVESFLAATPVLISNATPWRELEAARAGWDKVLDQAAWTEIIEYGIQAGDEQWDELRRGAAEYGRPLREVAVSEQRSLFERSLRAGPI